MLIIYLHKRYSKLFIIIADCPFVRILLHIIITISLLPYSVLFLLFTNIILLNGHLQEPIVGPRLATDLNFGKADSQCEPANCGKRAEYFPA